MDWLNILGFIVNIVGIVLTIVIYFRSVVQLRNAVKTAFQIDIRTMINRIERNKDKFKRGSPEAYKELHDIQDELESLSKKFLTMFEIK